MPALSRKTSEPAQLELAEIEAAAERLERS
jgi:hypothetical protein